MSRFNNNRGGIGMNHFQPRRGGGPGGPMRGGLMANPHFRNHPFQNQNQNRRGGNNNFNRPPHQGPQATPQKPQQNQGLPIIPPPTPGPALTMKGPMQQQQQKPAQEGQQTPVTPTAQSKIQSPPPKPNMTSPQPNQENKNQQLKSPVGNTNGQQQKPLPSPKTGPPQQGQKTGPLQQGQKTGPPQQGQKTGPQQGQRTAPQQGQKTGPQQGQRTGPQQGQRTGPPMTPNMSKQGRDEPERKSSNNNGDGSQPKVCCVSCDIFTDQKGVDSNCWPTLFASAIRHLVYSSCIHKYCTKLFWWNKENVVFGERWCTTVCCV